MWNCISKFQDFEIQITKTLFNYTLFLDFSQNILLQYISKISVTAHKIQFFRMICIVNITCSFNNIFQFSMKHESILRTSLASAYRLRVKNLSFYGLQVQVPFRIPSKTAAAGCQGWQLFITFCGNVKKFGKTYLRFV
jgi:hypothetical protein